MVEVIALILLPVAMLMVAYALMVFVWRASQIQKKQASGCAPSSPIHFVRRTLCYTEL